MIFSQTLDKEPNILVYIHSEDIDSDIKDIISKSISRGLGISGFNVINIENDTAITTLLETAEWMGAFFVIEGLYALKDSIVSFDITCYSVWDREKLISVSNKNRLSLSTDQYIEDALAEIIPVIRNNLYIVEQIILAAEEEQKIVEEEVIEKDPVIKIEYIPDQKEVNQQALSENILFVEKLEPDNEIREIREETNVRKSPGPFTIIVGGAPFVTTGVATEYFTRGIDFTFFGGYRIINSVGYLTPGIVISMDYFVAEGGELSSENILISLGPEIRVGMNFNYIADIFFRFSLAGTIFMMDANNTGYKSMLIPSCSLGLGVNYYFRENLGVSIVSNYSLFLESSTVITGFIPTIGVNYRF